MLSIMTRRGLLPVRRTISASRQAARSRRLFCEERALPPILLCINLEVLQRERTSSMEELKKLKEEYSICFYSKEKKCPGVNTLFTPTLHGDTLPVNVPDAGFLIYAIESLSGGDLGNALVVGCSPEDIKMAKRANVPILVCDVAGLAELKPDKIIRRFSLADINDAITGLKDASMY